MPILPAEGRSSLRRFRVGGAADDEGVVFHHGEPLARQLRDLDDEPHWRVLAVDQSLSDTGWAIVEAHGGVSWTGNIRTDPGSGHEGTLARSVELFAAFSDLLGRYHPVGRVVHETPPAGGRMARPEASLVAATALRCAAGLHGVPVVMVGAQRAKTRLCGDARASKAAVKAAVVHRVPSLATKKPLNQAITDAVALALVAREDGLA